MKIAEYLHPDLIFLLDVPSRDQALETMIRGLRETGCVEDSDLFYQAVLERENIVSTGIGMGTAIPHAKLPGYDHFFIAVGVLASGVDWKAIDQAPVRLIFLLGGPDDKQTEYLQILSGLTAAIKDENRRKKLLTLNSKQDIISLFEAF